ncbi:MAG: hypothetical protein M5U34_36840, partial [Chloroflexi bacterium]|nr:hypothetical protein [Chloroflexota bacterium]
MKRCKGCWLRPALTGLQQGPMSGGAAFNLLFTISWDSGQMAQPVWAWCAAALAAWRPRWPAPRSSLAPPYEWTPAAADFGGKRPFPGVRLQSGVKKSAPVVVSGATPRHTFTELVDPPPGTLPLGGRCAHQIPGQYGEGEPGLNGLPAFTALPAGESNRLHGRIQISPSLRLPGKAYDAANHGCFSPHPAPDIRIPSLGRFGVAAGQHVIGAESCVPVNL